MPVGPVEHREDVRVRVRPHVPPRAGAEEPHLVDRVLPEAPPDEPSELLDRHPDGGGLAIQGG